MKPEIYLIPNWIGVAAGTVVRKKQLTGGAESVLSITIAQFMTPLAMGRMANAISITRHGSVTLRVRLGVASSCRRRFAAYRERDLRRIALQSQNGVSVDSRHRLSN